MCGIAGFMGEVSPSFLDEANRIQSHRGPDNSGTWYNGDQKVGLAHTRLSIIDLSPSGNQPMKGRNGKVVIAFNGEIYNFPELRRKLESKGYKFFSNSDTEVLIHLYEEYGCDLLQFLNGIFAFAIFDLSKGEIFLARDGVGVKPLYYTESGFGFGFASELKSLLKLPGIDKSISEKALHYYMAYLWCPAPHTMLKSVKKLEPGHALRVKNGKIIKKWEYYDVKVQDKYFDLNENELAENLGLKIKECVERQMISDVPVGSFLSGGLDSSAVTYFAKQKAEHDFNCFTIAFKNSKGDFDGFVEDLPYAEKAAKHFNVKLNTIEVGPEIIDKLRDMIYFLDEPQADPAPLNAYFICKLARENNIKVLLSGAGGDDIFSGYRRHQALNTEKYWSWMPVFVRRLMKNMSSRGNLKNTFYRRMERAFRFADKSEIERLTGYFLWLNEKKHMELYSENFKKSLQGVSSIDPLQSTLKRLNGSQNNLNSMLYLELKHFLADHNLNYTDKMAMAHGVEVRVPLLDKELIDFASKINPKWKLKNGETKYIFKKAMEPFLPNNIIYRPKSGFGAPLRKWLHGDLKDVVQDMLSEQSIKNRGIFDFQTVKKLIKEDSDGRVDAAYNIFSLMCIEWWQRIFIDETC